VIPDHHLDGPEDAPMLVLANSLGTTRRLWEAQMPAFTSEFRVLRFDHRGHGLSSVAPGAYTMAMLAGDLVELLDRLGIARASVCGMSLGGAVAMQLAVLAPDRVERLVLACTTPRFGDPAVWRERAAIVRRDGTGVVADGAIGRWFTAHTREQHPDIPAHFRDDLLSVAAAGYAGCCDALAAWDFGGSLGSIAAPTLVVAGTDDPVVPPADAEVTASRIPGARLVVIDDAAHLANIDQPRAFEQAALEHLTGGAERRETV
jgi:3-oxoadipate enol-lactonase